MKKLRLEIEALTVETFATAARDGGARGTVRGRDSDAGVGTDPLNSRMYSESTCDANYDCGCIATAMTCRVEICYGGTEAVGC